MRQMRPGERRAFERAISLFGSQNRLALACGIPQQQINAIARGVRELDPYEAVAIERATQGSITRRMLISDLWD